jgi:hypothetical protein
VLPVTCVINVITVALKCYTSLTFCLIDGARLSDAAGYVKLLEVFFVFFWID